MPLPIPDGSPIGFIFIISPVSNTIFLLNTDGLTSIMSVVLRTVDLPFDGLYNVSISICLMVVCVSASTTFDLDNPLPLALIVSGFAGALPFFTLPVRVRVKSVLIRENNSPRLSVNLSAAVPLTMYDVLPVLTSPIILDRSMVTSPFVTRLVAMSEILTVFAPPLTAPLRLMTTPPAARAANVYVAAPSGFQGVNAVFISFDVAARFNSDGSNPLSISFLYFVVMYIFSPPVANPDPINTGAPRPPATSDSEYLPNQLRCSYVFLPPNVTLRANSCKFSARSPAFFSLSFCDNTAASNPDLDVGVGVNDGCVTIRLVPAGLTVPPLDLTYSSSWTSAVSRFDCAIISRMRNASAALPVATP